MRSTPVLLFNAVLIAALGGCTSVSFKQGAGGDEFRRAEADCRGTTSARSAFTQCMETKGWWTRSAEELSEIGFVPADPDETPANASAPAADTAPPVGSAVPAPSGAAAARAPATAPAVTPPKDPLSRVRIAMWAKAGAGGAELTADQDRCLSGLGDAHQPDPVAGTVTRGLYDCLRKQGWTGMTLR
ncbi:MAG TPA: hypothetical protein VIO81_02970 [Methyloversatilis sp.]